MYVLLNCYNYMIQVEIIEYHALYKPICINHYVHKSNNIINNIFPKYM